MKKQTLFRRLSMGVIAGVVAFGGLNILISQPASAAGTPPGRYTDVIPDVSLPADYIGHYYNDQYVAVRSGTTLTFDLKAEYTDSTVSPAIVESVAIPETARVRWEYCVTNCVTASAQYATLTETQGTRITLTNLTQSTTIRPVFLDTSFVRGDSTTPRVAGLSVAVVNDPSAIKVYANWENIGPYYSLHRIISEDPNSVGPIEDRLLALMSVPTTYQVAADGTRTVFGSSTISANTDYVTSIAPPAATDFAASPGMPSSESAIINTNNPAMEASVAKPVIDTARVYAAPNLTASAGPIVQVPTPVTGTPVVSTPLVTLPEAKNGESLQEVKTEATTGVKAPEAGVELHEGWSFKIAGARANAAVKVKIALSKSYSDTSTLRAYKAKAGVLSKITSAAFTNEGGKTYLSYDLVDGGALDEDGVANGTIVDPVYVGTEAGALAETGVSSNAVAIVAIGVIALSVLMFVTRKQVIRE